MIKRPGRPPPMGSVCDPVRVALRVPMTMAVTGCPLLGLEIDEIDENEGHDM
jgi:hypothetical protein